MVQLSNGGSNGHRGERIPLVHLEKMDNGELKLLVASTINDAHNYLIFSPFFPLNVGQSYALEIHQRYLKNGKYRFFILFDDVEVFSIINTRAEQFYDVKVWACPIWNYPSAVEISNFEHINFL